MREGARSSIPELKEDRASRWSFGLLGCALIFAPQLLGGALAWTVAVTSGVCGLLAIATARLGRRRRFAWEPIDSLVLIPLGFTLLQAFPLPRWLVQRVNDHAVAGSDNMRACLGEAPAAWATVSMDPGRTFEEILKGLAIASVFLAARQLVARGHRRHVLSLVLASVSAMAFVGLVHIVVDADTVFGLYSPQFVEPGLLLAPLLNANHLGGFFLMGIPIALERARSEGEPSHRFGYLLLTGVLIVMLTLTLSRGAMVAAALALGLTLVLSYQRPESSDVRATRAQYGWLAFTVLGLLVVAYLVGPFASGQFHLDAIEKIERLPQVLEHSLASPWVGVGRGAFGASFVADYGTTTRALYAENFFAQWVVEWGWPLTLFLTVSLAKVLWVGLRQGRGSRVVASVALLALSLQNLVDFSFEMTGVVLPAAALLASAAPAPARIAKGVAKGEGRQRRRRLVAVAVASTLGSLALAPMAHRWSVDVLYRDLGADLQAGRAEAFHEKLRTAVLLHPFEPQLTLIAGVEAGHRRDVSAAWWFNRTMVLAPGWPTTHVAAAQWLVRIGHVDQAMLELRQSAQRDLDTGLDTFCALRESAELGFDEAMLSSPGDTRAEALSAVTAEFLSRAAACLEPVAQRRLDLFLIERGVTRLAPYEREVVRLRSEGDQQGAVALLEGSRDRVDSDRFDYVLAAALIDASEAERALSLLRGESREVCSLRARAYQALGNYEEMRAQLNCLRREAGSDARDMAAASRLMGNLERRAGNLAAALSAFEESNRFHRDYNVLEDILELTNELGDHRRAATVRAELCNGGRRVHCAGNL